MNKIKIQKEYLFVATTGLLSGLIIFGGEIFKRNGFSLLELSILPFFPALIILFPFVKGKGAQFKDKNNLKLIFTWSLIGALVIIFQFGAIVAGLPVALAVLLLYTQPIWTVIINKYYLKTSIKSVDIYNVFLVFIGIFILVNPLSVHGVNNLPGIIIGLMGGLALSGWVVIGSLIGKSKIDPYVGKYIETLFEIALVPLILIAVRFAINDPSIIKFSLNWTFTIWLAVIVYCLLTQVIGHVLYLKGTKKVLSMQAGILLLLEPVSGAILAAIFIHQPLTLNIIIGGTLILIANYLVITKKATSTLPNLSEKDLLKLLKKNNFESSPLFYKALEQAKKSHENQKRDDESPYLEQHIYPIVADLVECHKGKQCSEELLIGALLHDALEDDSTLNEEIFAEKFGENILSIVKPLTKVKNENSADLSEESKKKINKKMLEKIEMAPLSCRLIKLADRTNNLCCTVERQDIKPAKTKRYLEETKEYYLPFAKKENEYFYKKISKLLSK